MRGRKGVEGRGGGEDLGGVEGGETIMSIYYLTLFNFQSKEKEKKGKKPN